MTIPLDRSTRVRPARALLLALLAAGCSSAAGPGTTTGVPPASCVFTNPLGAGADPWVTRLDGTYYFVESRDRGIYVYKSDALTDLRRNGVRVWSAPATGWNSGNVWAPELHFFDGRWYVYYAAGPKDGGPFVHQRAGVLESVGGDPQGAYVDRGMLYTGNDVAADTGAIWAIDLTVGRVNGQLYAVWSGWTDNAPAPGSQPDRKAQQLYIARMANPWTIGSNRALLSAPTESWERGTELDLQEGPEFLRNPAGQVFVVYSTRESWLPDYRLGQLRLKSADADPMDPANVVKSGPVFTGTPEVYGVGHASFTLSPDDRESWIVYHSKTSPSPGWDRVVRAQKFGWNADGSPSFGTPLPSGTAAPLPSGQPCQ